MAIRRKQIRDAPSTPHDLSFPVPYCNQAKYLQLADAFLAENPRHNGSKAVSIDTDKQIAKSRIKKATA